MPHVYSACSDHRRAALRLKPSSCRCRPPPRPNTPAVEGLNRSELDEGLAQRADGLGDALLVLDQGEAHEALAARSEADAG